MSHQRQPEAAAAGQTNANVMSQKTFPADTSCSLTNACMGVGAKGHAAQPPGPEGTGGAPASRPPALAQGGAAQPPPAVRTTPAS